MKGKEQTEILPVFWEDNCISLLPGEKREVTVNVRKTDLAVAQPTLLVDGLNDLWQPALTKLRSNDSPPQNPLIPRHRMVARVTFSATAAI